MKRLELTIEDRPSLQRAVNYLSMLTIYSRTVAGRRFTTHPSTVTEISEKVVILVNMETEIKTWANCWGRQNRRFTLRGKKTNL